MKKLLLLSVLSIVWYSGCCNQCGQKQKTAYAISHLPTPVLTTSDFGSVFGGKDGKSLSLNEKGAIYGVEITALPGTIFRIEDTIRKDNATIYKVTTSDYPYSDIDLFIDSRFVETVAYKPAEREEKLPPKQQVIEKLLSAQGITFLWGGNCKEGIPQLLDFYPPSGAISATLKEQWILKGMDCSGLLYWSTDGFTVRNTGSLVNFGRPIEIAGLSIEQIIEKVEPLDIIVYGYTGPTWKGHVIIILDKEKTIESCDMGVSVKRLKDVLAKLTKTDKRMPVDWHNYKIEAGKQFVIRRFYD